MPPVKEPKYGMTTSSAENTAKTRANSRPMTQPD